MPAPPEPSPGAGAAGRLAGRDGPWLPVPMVALTLASGAVDAIGFMTLGGVFTSVMTANLALLGVSAGSRSSALAGHVLVALAGFMCGVTAGSAVAARTRRARPRRPSGESLALCLELLLMCGFLAGWTASDGRPDGTLRTVLLAVAALAMGCQSGTVRVAVSPDLSTTFVTGALTGVLTDLATKGALQRRGLTLVGVLPVGAALSACLVTWARPVAPVLPTVLLAAVTAYSLAPAARGPRGAERVIRDGRTGRRTAARQDSRQRAD